MSFDFRHVLYRLCDRSGALLYVGITANINRRFTDHAGEQPWWDQVVDCKVDFLPTRRALAEAERVAINAEQPRYNRIRYARREVFGRRCRVLTDAERRDPTIEAPDDALWINDRWVQF